MNLIKMKHYTERHCEQSEAIFHDDKISQQIGEIATSRENAGLAMTC